MSTTVRELTFAEVLATLEGGETVREMRVALDSCVADVLNTGNPGTVTLQLSIKRASHGQVHITDTVKLTPPKRNKGGNIFFRHPQGGLTRNDPEQYRLEDLHQSDVVIDGD